MGINFRQVLIFGAGLITGGALGAFLTKKYYKDLAEQEIEDVRKYYYENEDIDEMVVEDLDVLDTITSDYISKETKDEERVDYTSYYNNIVKNNEEVSQEKIKKTQRKNSVIDIITEEEFEEGNAYEKVYLVWYDGDNHLVDISGIEYTLHYIGGKKTLETLKEAEDEVIYIKDDASMVMYEVQYTEGAYEED